MDITKIVPSKVAHFLQPERDEQLEKLVEDYTNVASYNTQTDFQSRSVLTALRDVPAMLQDPIIQSALACVMNTAFQTDVDNKVFQLTSPSAAVADELNRFHENIDAQNLVLTTAYNLLCWGQLPFKHSFSKDGVLERVIPVPDFTQVTPIVLSGKTIGFIEDGKFLPSYAYTYGQSSYYKNLGGNVGNRYVTISSPSNDNEEFTNEFTYANSYLSASSKAWRNINIIEDALLLNRMDQSNYYRLISVNVGGQVYSKSAIKVLNYYRNLFKKVRRVSYDSDGMASKGNGQNFEVIIPQTQNQGIDVKNIGGEIDVKALKDLDTQYNRLFASLQIQPSMIGFSSDVPSSLGDSTATAWDKRFARVCKAYTYATFNTLRNIDFIHLRSLGFDVSMDDWKYTTVSSTVQEDNEKGETLKTAIDNLKSMSEVLRNLDTEYNKPYLVKSLLRGSLNSFGIDVEQLMSLDDKTQDKQTLVASAIRARNYRKRLLEDDKRVMVNCGLFTETMATEITAALTAERTTAQFTDKMSPVSIQQLFSSVATPPGTPIDMKDIVIPTDEEDDIAGVFSKRGTVCSHNDTVPLTLPVMAPKSIVLSSDDMALGAVRALHSVYVDPRGYNIVTSKADLVTYLHLYMNDSKDAYCENVIRSK